MMDKASTGFSLVEILVATFMIVLIAAGTHLLLGSTTQFSGRRARAYEAIEYAGQTLDTLKDYVTGNPNRPDGTYELTGDPSPPCGSGPPGRWALVDLPIPDEHCHPLPAGAFNDPGARRTYNVEDIDLNPGFDTDGDGDTTNDVDIKRIRITVSWTEPG